MTTIVKFELKHLDAIKMREPDRSEVAGIPHFRKVCELYEKNGGAYTLLSPEGVVCIAGVAPVIPGVGTAWSVTSDLVRKYPKTYYKSTKQFMAAIASDWRLHRLQATTLVKNRTAIRWLEHLGFKREGRMRKYGADGADHYLYARVN